MAAPASGLVVACGAEEGSPSGSDGACEGSSCDAATDSSAADGSATSDAPTVADGGADARPDADGGGPSSCSGDAGGLDLSFGEGGTAFLPTNNSAAYAVLLQPDGKAILGGYIGKPFALVRLTQAGGFDSTFGDAGAVQTMISSRTSGVSALAIQPDGKIIASGSAAISANGDFVVVRYTPTGALDTTFGNAGVAHAPFGADAIPASVAVLPDGHILVSGTVGSPSGPSGKNYGAARFNADGALDTTFGTNGIVTFDVRTSQDIGGAMAVQPDGKFVLVGRSTQNLVNALSDISAVRFNADGSLDPAFGTSGVMLTNFGSGELEASGVALDGLGRLVLVGSSFSAGNQDIALVRITGAGLVDTTFGTSGLVVTDLGQNDSASKIFVQGDGKLVVAGFSYPTGGLSSIAVARYSSNGVLDPSFGQGGTTRVGVAGFDSVGATGAVLGGCGLTVAAPWESNSGLHPVFIGAARFTL